jgi:hypothetical protein
MPRLGLDPNCSRAGLGLLAHLRQLFVDWCQKAHLVSLLAVSIQG